MDTSTIGLLYAGVTLLLLFSGMPIAFALGLSALGFMALFMPAPNLQSVAETIFSELDNFTLLTIPLFVLMGAAIGKTRAGADVYTSLNAWMHKIPGGLGLANVFACAVFAAMCGSSPATCSAIGSSGIPQLVKRGYSEGLATGIIAAGGTLGILIPPSLTLILYGLASEQSIGRLFMAGIGPGVLLVLLFAFWVMFKYSLEHRAASRNRDAAASDASHAGAAILEQEQITWHDRLSSLPRLLPFLVLIAVIMIAMYDGWATPSEIAGIGSTGSLILVLTLYRCWRRDDLKAILLGTVRESTMIMMIIATSFLFTYVMSYLGVTQAAAAWLVQLGLTKWSFFFWVNVFIVGLGFFLPPVAIILMITPIILPTLTSLGIDLVWFGIIMTILMEMGLIHPPVGLNLFVINGIAPEIKLRNIVWGTMPFIGLMVLGILALCVFPEIALWLPNHLYKGG
ncbi:MAG TPA: TRAP transporter large permease subunit [Rhodocyclaceae bacterium]|nr:TRAP transporter large permease subunit [Rhodocyclaceae bacterium]